MFSFSFSFKLCCCGFFFFLPFSSVYAKGDEIHSSHKINQYSLRSHSFLSQRQASVLTRRDQTKRQSASATVVPASRSLHKHSMSTSARFPSSILSSSPWLPNMPSWRCLFQFILYFVNFKFVLDSNNISNCAYNR